LIGRIAPDFSRFYSRLDPNEKQGIIPLGVLSETSKHALLELSSLLVLPSRSDSFGIVLLEAWAHNKPVIGAEAGGIPCVIEHNINGFVVEFSDVEGLAHRISQLLNDTNLSNTFATNGQQKLKAQYNWSTVSERVLDRYREVLLDNH
jgi:glycosyltransferase involved in cell wall biosynthesis